MPQTVQHRIHFVFSAEALLSEPDLTLPQKTSWNLAQTMSSQCGLGFLRVKRTKAVHKRSWKLPQVQTRIYCFRVHTISGDNGPTEDITLTRFTVMPVCRVHVVKRQCRMMSRLKQHMQYQDFCSNTLLSIHQTCLFIN